MESLQKIALRTGFYDCSKEPQKEGFCQHVWVFGASRYSRELCTISQSAFRGQNRSVLPGISCYNTTDNIVSSHLIPYQTWLKHVAVVLRIPKNVSLVCSGVGGAPPQRQTPTGRSWGPPGHPQWDLPQLEPAALEPAQHQPDLPVD